MKRQIQKPLHEVFNDGFLVYGKESTQRDKGKKIGESFAPEGKLAFKLMSAREEDYQLAMAMSATLDLKVKTMRPPSFQTLSKANLKCIIDGIKYDVIQMDGDAGKRYLYFYLQNVGVVNE